MKQQSIRLLFLSLLIIIPQFSNGEIIETKPIQKQTQKLTFKQKLVKKWAERKVKKQKSENKMLSNGKKSMIWGALSALSILLFGSLYGSIIMVFTLLAGLYAIRLGAKALKSGEDKKSARLGLILGSIGALAVLLIGLFYLSVYLAF